MKLRPVNDKIVVKPIEKDEIETTAAGIILPDSVDGGSLLEGEVMAAGQGMYSTNGTLIPIVVEVGDIILFSKHNGGQEHKLDGENVLIMSQNEVLSIVEEE